MPLRAFSLLAIGLLLLLTACSNDSDDDATPSNTSTADVGADTPITQDTDNPTPDTRDPTDTDPTDTDPPDAAQLPDGRVITADWLNGTLTVFSYGKLITGAGAADAITSTIDLSPYPPGPLQLELTPDGSEAIVSVGPGFFDGLLGGLAGASEVPPGGTLLIVSLESGAVRAQIETDDVPMGIAISPDGTRAYTANFGADGVRGNTLSVINLTAGALIEEITIGGGPEQVALDPSGQLGVVNLAGGGGVRFFETRDVPGTLSPLIDTGNDPSDVTFIGEGLAVVVNSQSFDATLIDASDLAAPTVVNTLSIGGGLPYGVDLIPGTARALITVSSSPSILNVVRVEEGVLVQDGTIELSGGSFPMNAAVDAEGRFAFVPHPIDGSLSVVDLAAGEAQAVQWLEGAGPTYVVVDN